MILRTVKYVSLRALSHVRCPLCGKDSAFRSFNPEGLDRDIYIRQAIRLGYGEGFTHGPDESVLGDEVFTPKIKDRCIDLLRLFIEKNIITSKELESELKIGVPVQVTDTIIPYADFIDGILKQIEPQKQRIKNLETQVNIDTNNVSISKYRELETRLKQLVDEQEIKRVIETILKRLHEILDSKIELREDNWVLEVYRYDPLITKYICKALYGLNREERSLLEKRIKTECDEFKHIFTYFKKEPTILSWTDSIEKKPGIIYYEINELQIPDYCLTDVELQTLLKWENIF